MFASTNNSKVKRTVTVRLSFSFLASILAVVFLVIFYLLPFSTETTSTAAELAFVDKTEPSFPTAPVWRFSGTSLRPNWPSAQIVSERADTRGGEVVVAMRGLEIYYCPRRGGEKVRFKWEFDRDVSVLRQGDDISVTLHVEPVSRDNYCTGQLEEASSTGAVTSNSSHYTPEEGPLYEDRIKHKKGEPALGGDRNPSRRNSAIVLWVDTWANITKNKIRFSIRASGPCDHPQPYSCGWYDFQYNYDLDATGGGEPRPTPGDGGGTGNACGFSVGSGIYGKWVQTGGLGGYLGCARSDEREAGRSPFGTGGRYALFSGWANAAVIIWHANGRFAGRSFAVHGAIGQLYQSLGGTNSWLGFPISDEYDVPGGRRSDFEGGYILWDSRTGRAQAFKYPTADYEKGAAGGTIAFAQENNVSINQAATIRFFALQSASPEPCREACAGNSDCVAYTFVRPGAYNANDPPMCYLFSKLGQKVESACCISGFRK